MESLPQAQEQLLEALLKQELITKSQEQRVRTAIRRGMQLAEALAKTPLVDPVKLATVQAMLRSKPPETELLPQEPHSPSSDTEERMEAPPREFVPISADAYDVALDLDDEREAEETISRTDFEIRDLGPVSELPLEPEDRDGDGVTVLDLDAELEGLDEDLVLDFEEQDEAEPREESPAQGDSQVILPVREETEATRASTEAADFLYAETPRPSASKATETETPSEAVPKPEIRAETEGAERSHKAPPSPRESSMGPQPRQAEASAPQDFEELDDLDDLDLDFDEPAPAAASDNQEAPLTDLDDELDLGEDFDFSGHAAPEIEFENPPEELHVTPLPLLRDKRQPDLAGDRGLETEFDEAMEGIFSADTDLTVSEQDEQEKFSPLVPSGTPEEYEPKVGMVQKFRLEDDEGIALIGEVNDLLKEAIGRGCSALEFDTEADGSSVRFYDTRGCRQEVRPLEDEKARKMINRVKVMARLEAWRRESAQRGKFRAFTGPLVFDVLVDYEPGAEQEELITLFFQDR